MEKIDEKYQENSLAFVKIVLILKKQSFDFLWKVAVLEKTDSVFWKLLQLL